MNKPNSTWQYVAFVIDVFARRIVGSRGDSYDNALAETINGLYKVEDPPPCRLENQRGGGTGYRPGSTTTDC